MPEPARVSRYMRRSNFIDWKSAASAVPMWRVVSQTHSKIATTSSRTKKNKNAAILVHRPVNGVAARLQPNFTDDYETYCVRAACRCPGLHVIKSEFVPSCTQHRNPPHVINVNFNLNLAHGWSSSSSLLFSLLMRCNKFEQLCSSATTCTAHLAQHDVISPNNLFTKH